MKPKLLRFRPLFDRIVWTPPLSNEEKQPTLVESLLPVTPLCQLRRASSDSLHDRWPNIPVGQSVGAHTKGSGEWIKHHGFLSTAILHFSCGFQFGSLNVWVSRCFQVGLQLWLVVYDVFPAFCPVGAVSKCFPNGYLQKWWDSSDGHGKGNHHQYNNYSDGDLKEYEIHCTVGRFGWGRKHFGLGASWFWEAPSLENRWLSRHVLAWLKEKGAKHLGLCWFWWFSPSVQSISAASIQLSSLQAALVIYFVVDHVGWWKQVLW